MPRREGSGGLVSASRAVVLGSLAVACTELVREALIAARFGTSEAMDAFFGVWILPSVLIGSMMYLGRLVVVPVGAHRLEDGPREAAGFLGALFLACVGMCLVLVLLAEPLVSLLLPGLGGSARGTAVQSIQVLAPYLVGGVLSAYLVALLHARHRFLAAALLAVLPNLFVIAAVLVWGDVSALGWGFSAGAMAQAIFLWVALQRDGFPLVPSTLRAGRFGKEVLALSLAPALFIGIRNLAPIVDRAAASLLEPGSVAQLNYAYRLTVGARVLVTGTAFTVSVPFLAAMHARGETAAMGELVTRGLRAVVLVMALVWSGLLVFGTDAVGVLLMRGELGPHGAQATGSVLAVMSGTLLPDAVLALLVAPFFARREPAVPLKVVAVVWPLHLLLVWPAARMWGVEGIAGVGVAVAFAACLAMGWRLRGEPGAAHLDSEGRRDLWGALLGAVAVFCVGHAVRPLLPTLADPLPSRALGLGVAGIGAVWVYGLVVGFVTRRRLRDLWEIARGKSSK